MISIRAAGAAVVSTLMLLSAPAWAAKGLDYSYGDIGYEYLDGDDFEMDAAKVELSFGVHEYVALQAAYLRGWTDDFSTGVDPSGDPDLNEFRIGLRPHYTLVKNLDAYIDTVYFNRKFNGARSNSDLGWIYGGGLRYKPFKKFELRVAGEYRSGNIDEAFIVVGPVVKLTKKLSASLRTSQGNDSADYFAGFRLSF